MDAGAPVIDLLLRYGKDINKLRAVFTTHSHSDHTMGIMHLANLMSWYYKESAADIYVCRQAQIDSYLAVMAACSAGGFAFPENRVRFHVTDPENAYEDENIKLTYFRNKHMDVSYSILVTEKATGKTALFSGDFSGSLRERDVPAILAEEEIDAFICEMAHFGVKHITPYLETCKAKNVYFNHVFPLEKYDDIEAIKGKYRFKIHTPKDGDTVEL